MTDVTGSLMDVVRDTPRPGSRRRGFLTVGVAGTLVAGALGWATTRGAGLPAVDGAALVIDSVVRGPLRREVRAPGSLQAARTWILTTATAGRVDALLVPPGTVVSAGQAIVRLSNPEVDQAVLETERQLAVAEASRASQETSLQIAADERQQALVVLRGEWREAVRQRDALRALAPQGFSTPNEVARATERAEELATRVTLAEQAARTQRNSLQPRAALEREAVGRLAALVQGAQARRAAMTVRAPAAGVVQELRVELGAWVGVGQPLALLGDATALRAELRVAEAQARDVRVGQGVLLEARGGDGASWRVRGRVAAVAPAVRAGTVLVTVQLDEAPPADAARDLALDATIALETIADALVLRRPANARPNSDGVLYRLDADGRRATRVAVRFGRAASDRIEVLGGLAPGDRVIVSDLPVEGRPDVVTIAR